MRTYVKVQVRHDKLVVENVRSGTCAAPNAEVEHGESGATTPPADQPVGSIVDKVAISPYHGDGQDIQVDVPNAGSG